MEWAVREKYQPTPRSPRITFSSRDLAEAAIGQTPLVEAYPITDNNRLFGWLMEGLVQGDLRRIILPQVSIDEYVPGDPETDNVVIAFFIKGVPEAVIPFRDFVMKSRGVLDVAYGDSDTIPNTSIVYAEMARENFKFEDLYDIMDQVSMLSQLDVSDFSLVFPNSSDRHPYDPETIQAYFTERSVKRNLRAQQAALDKADDDQETTGSSEEEQDRIEKDEVEEAIIDHLVEAFGNS